MTQLSRADNWRNEWIDHLDERERRRLLADEQRKTVLDVLARTRGTTRQLTLGELASDVDRRGGGPKADLERSKQDLLTQLHHVHLPVLDGAGIVDYDPVSKHIDLDGPTAAGAHEL